MGIDLSSLWNVKAKKLRAGMRASQIRLREGWWKDNIAPKDLIWIHCASLGEFEMAKPIAAALQAAASSVAVRSRSTTLTISFGECM